MFEKLAQVFKKMFRAEQVENNSKDTAKERLHLVLMQDRANVSADFLELMKQEIIDVIKKYIDVDENAIDVRLTNKTNDDGTTGAPALYANIPITNVKTETTNKVNTVQKEEVNKEQKIEAEQELVKEENNELKLEETTEKEHIEEVHNKEEKKEEEIKQAEPAEKIEEANRIINNTPENK